MLEENRIYAYAELSAIFGTRDTQGIKRRLSNYGVAFETTGRSNGIQFHIKTISQKFQLFCVLDLGFSPNVDFEKLRDFLFYLMDDDFNWRPMEMMEEYLRNEGKGISRQTISRYLEHLSVIDIRRDNGEMVYYKVYKYCGEQRHKIITRKEYAEAWRVYWNKKYDGYDSQAAYRCMYNKCGGVPRKQRKIEGNAFYNDKYNLLSEYIADSFLTEDGA